MVINKNTIISVFNDKMTLLQYLKSVEKLLKESALSTIELIRVDNDYFKVKCVFSDNTFIESNKFLLMDANTLLNYIEGSEHVIVDLNEAGKKLKVHLDNDLVTKLPKLDFALVSPQDAPAGYAVVTINDLGQQENVMVGNSLIVTTENGENKLETYRDILNPINLYELLEMENNHDGNGSEFAAYKTHFNINQVINLINHNINKGLIFKVESDGYLWTKNYPLRFLYLNLENVAEPINYEDKVIQFIGINFNDLGPSGINGGLLLNFHAASNTSPVYISIHEI